jgi:oligoribonuclease (3'-5' exoribonuclease)
MKYHMATGLDFEVDSQMEWAALVTGNQNNVPGKPL